MTKCFWAFKVWNNCVEFGPLANSNSTEYRCTGTEYYSTVQYSSGSQTGVLVSFVTRWPKNCDTLPLFLRDTLDAKMLRKWHRTQVRIIAHTLYIRGVQTILPKEPNYMGTKNSSIQNVYKNFSPRSQIWLRSHCLDNPVVHCTCTLLFVHVMILTFFIKLFAYLEYYCDCENLLRKYHKNYK